MNKDTVNDRFFVTKGRKDWQLLLEKRNNKTPPKVSSGHMGKQGNAGPMTTKPRKGTRSEQERTAINMGEEATVAPSQGDGPNNGVFKARIPGIGMQKRPVATSASKTELHQLEETSEETSEPNTFSKKAETIAKRKEKLEKQLQDMDAEMQRLMKLEDLQKQKDEIISQLEAIKDEMDAVKNDKAVETKDSEEVSPEIEGSEGETEEKEDEEKEDEEKEDEEKEDEEKEDEEKEDEETEDEKPEPRDLKGIFNKLD